MMAATLATVCNNSHGHGNSAILRYEGGRFHLSAPRPSPFAVVAPAAQRRQVDARWRNLQFDAAWDAAGVFLDSKDRTAAEEAPRLRDQLVPRA